MIWDRRRRDDDATPPVPPVNSFAEVLEDAPLMALLVEADRGVIDANRAARAIYEIDASRLPSSLVGVTLEVNRVERLAPGDPRSAHDQVHHPLQA